MAQREVSFQVFRGSKEGKIVKATTTRSLGPNDVVIKLTHSGLCGTDLHYLKAGSVLGHEGVGVIEETGPLVSKLKRGDRVGFGYIHKVCGHCESCLNGLDQFCVDAQTYGRNNLDQGSFGTHVVWDADMVATIPESISLRDAAPLMCAGATVWTVLATYGMKPGDRVGIQGIGGLGHLAIQYAAKLGFEVIVLSSSESKRAEATKLGATHFYVMKEGFKLPADKKLNHLLICGSANPDYTSLTELMAANGTIYPLTASRDPTPICILDLVLKGVRIQGSFVAARPSINRMLNFTAMHDIRPVVMEWPMNEKGIEEAIQSLQTGKVRYRAVLTI